LVPLLPAGSLGHAPFARAAGPSESSAASGSALPARWAPDPTPSHVGTAERIGTVDLRNLPSASPNAAPVDRPAASTARPFVHAATTAHALGAFLTPALQSIGAGFEGLNDSQCGCAPPDVIDAAGPTEIVEMVNLWMEVWTKQGVPVYSVSAPSFFGSGSDFLSDPRILYDNQSGRWFASIFDAGASGTGLIRFAVSSTSDAGGTWTVYSTLTSSSGEFPDQPILGVSDHLIAFGGNMFSESTGGFFGAEYWVVDKAALLNGTSATLQSWGPDPNYLSIHPVQSLGSTATQYFVSSTSASSTSVTLWAVTGVPPTASRVVSNLTVAGYATAPPGRAPGGGQVDSADTRVQVAVWQSGDLWMAFDDQCTPSGDTAARACVRIIEIVTATAQVLQDFDYGISGLDLYYPGIALDRAGDMTMVFGYSSTTVDPSGGVTGQAATDPSGSMDAYRTVVAGSATFNCGGPCRYGDYFGVGADPTDATVWVAAEYLTPLHNWDSWIAPVVTTGPASTRLSAAPAAIDVGSAVTVALTGENVTCSSLLGLYCAASVPLGDGTIVGASCSASAPAFSWNHTYALVGTYPVGLGGYLSEFTTLSCTSGSEALNLTLSPYSLVVSLAPVVQLTASPANGADVGQAFALSAAVGGGQPPFAFQWTGLPTGCAASTGPIVNCTATTTGSWIVGVNATDANGVSRVRTLPFVVAPALATSIAATRTVLDVGQEDTLVATASGGTGSYAYLWTGLPTGCFGTNLSNLACTPTAAGTFPVQELTNDTNGFSVVSATITLTLRPALLITLVPPPNGQVGRAEVFEATVTGGTAPYSYTWSGLPSQCASANSTQLVCTPSGSGSWSVEVAVVDGVGGSANATVGWSVSNGSGIGTLVLAEVVAIGAVASVAVVAIAVLLRRRRSPRSPSGPA